MEESLIGKDINMHHKIQNLNEDKKKLFDFRGWFYDKHHRVKINYELCSGPACKLSVDLDHEDGPAFSFIFGLLLFTLYLTIPRPRFWKWGAGKQYGFYWMDKECRFFWGEKSMESGHGWYWYFRPLDLLFGKTVHYNEREMFDNYQPIHFIFRDKEYQLDKVFIQKWFVFRTRIPFGLWHREGVSLDIKIDKPPMHSGKGTTSYNCDDDGTYGMSGPYKGPKITKWNEREKLYQYAVEYYCENAYNDIKRYGRAGGDTVDSKDPSFKFIGFKKDPNNNDNVGTEARP